jgi:hypothetical protein
MVADTGASCHIFTSTDWMINVQTTNESRGIRVGGQRVIEQQGIGDLPVTFKDKDGCAGPSVTLKNVKISENFGFNLFSLTCAMSFSWSIRSKHRSIIVTKDDLKIDFDVAVKTRIHRDAHSKPCPILVRMSSLRSRSTCFLGFGVSCPS